MTQAGWEVDWAHGGRVGGTWWALDGHRVGIRWVQGAGKGRGTLLFSDTDTMLGPSIHNASTAICLPIY